MTDNLDANQKTYAYTHKDILKLRHVYDSIGVFTINPKLNNNEVPMLIEVLKVMLTLPGIVEVCSLKGRGVVELENNWKAFI